MPQPPCSLCGRRLPLTIHHLVPKKLHGNKWFKKNFTREELLRTVALCRECHDAVHAFLDEKELGRNFNTLDKLLSHEKIAAFVRWAAKKGRA